MKKRVETLKSLPVSLIERGDNDRTIFDSLALQELAESIKENGLQQPIIVRPKKSGYQIVAGERRFRAIATILKWKKVDCIVRELNDEQAAAIMLLENVHRVDIDPIDEAFADRKRMRQFGWSVAQIARHANVNEKRVADRLKLCTIVPECQKLIRSKQITYVWGEVLSVLDYNRQRIALQYVASSGKPVLREFRAIVNKLLEEQMQETLFDNTQYLINTALAGHQDERAERYTLRVPKVDYLPDMKRNGGIGASFEAYIAELMTSEDKRLRNAAPIVGKIYESMVKGGMCYPPNNR